MGLFSRKPPMPIASVLTASANQVPLASWVAEASRFNTARHDWQKLSWDYYNAIGFVAYGLDQLANIISRVRLIAAEMPEERDQKPVMTTKEEAWVPLDDMEGPLGGPSEILRVLALNLSVPGEGLLVGLQGRADMPGYEEPTWQAASREEVVKKGDGSWVLKLPDERGLDAKEVPLNLSDSDVTNGTNDFLLRVWKRHASKAGEADSSMRHILGPCEELLIQERALRAIGKSRTNAGLLLYPAQANIGNTTSGTLQGPQAVAENQLMKQLIQTMSAPLGNEGDASALVPMIWEMDAELIEKVKLLMFDRKVDAHVIQRLLTVMQQIVQGLNLPPEIVTGIGKANHWGAWQIEDSQFTTHVAPLLELILAQLTRGWYRRALKANGIGDPSRYLLWYDPSTVVERPNRGDDAKDLHDRIVISDAALRDANNFSDDDAPDEAEIERRGGRKRGPANEGGDPIPDEPDDNEGEQGSDPGENAVQAAALVAAGQMNGAALGRRFGDIDRALSPLLIAAFNAEMDRVLNRAAAKVITATGKPKNRGAARVIQDVPRLLVMRTLGPAMVADMELTESGLVSGSFSGLESKYNAWTERAQAQARKLIPGLTDSQKETLAAQQALDRAEAWAWTNAHLESLAQERLYDPNPAGPDVGEFDSSVRVQAGTIRESVARAGGAKGLTSTGDGIGITVQAGTEPAGGIGTGQAIMDVMLNMGAGVEAYEWDYGSYPRSRPFEPHELLDGVTFTTWDDPVLANYEDFPDNQFLLPGDHAGCSCSHNPIILLPKEIG